MTSIAEVLKTKPQSQIHSVAPDDTVFAALQLMANSSIGAVLVMDGGKIAGIFTERDYARKVVLQGRSSGETTLSQVMTTAVRCVQPSNTVEQCMALMTENRIRHLPVVQEDAVVGLVSIGDLVKSIIAHQQHLIEQMEQYIAGSW